MNTHASRASLNHQERYRRSFKPGDRHRRRKRRLSAYRLWSCSEHSISYDATDGAEVVMEETNMMATTSSIEKLGEACVDDSQEQEDWRGIPAGDRQRQEGSREIWRGRA